MDLTSHHASFKQVRSFSTSVLRQNKDCESEPSNSEDSSYTCADNETTEVSLGDGPKWWLVFDRPMQNSLEVATKFIQSGEPVTADIINKILSIYNIHVTEDGLNLLINTPILIFDNLSKSLYKDSYFLEKLGKISDREVKGVYIFTHKKKTGSKYVGSSIQLATRLQRYLAGTHKEYGKFIPFLSEEGLQKFSLEVIPLYSSVIFKGELILEQYFLLDSTFNLNTSRVVNQPNYKTKEIFMYNKNKTLLIYLSAERFSC